MSFGPPDTKDRYHDVKEHAFLAEVDQKIIFGRVHWWDRYNKEHEDDPVDDHEHSRRYYILQKRFMAGVPFPSPGVFDKVSNLKPTDHRIRIKTYDDNLKKMYDNVMEGDPHLLDIMYPVLPEHDEVLHGSNCLSGLHGQGRCEYLRLRNGEAYEPAFKHHLPTIHSFDYGWNSKATQVLEKSPYLRKSQLKNELPGVKKKPLGI